MDTSRIKPTAETSETPLHLHSYFSRPDTSLMRMTISELKLDLKASPIFAVKNCVEMLAEASSHIS
jgi:hypothetical protein